MKRFKVQTGDSRTLLLYYRTQAEAQEHWPDATVEESDDQSHIEYIQRMLDSAAEHRTVERHDSTVHFLWIYTPVGRCAVCLFQDAADSIWFDFCKYQLWKTGAVVEPFGWNVSNPADFCKRFLFPNVEYAMLTKDKSGPKPRELRGVKKFVSIPFGVEQRKCQLYLKGNDLYINHANYFSPEGYTDEISPKTQLPKHVVYIRKVWLRITNFVPMVKILNASQISHKVWSMIQKYHSWPSYERNTDWDLFLEVAAKATAEYLNVGRK